MIEGWKRQDNLIRDKGVHKSAWQAQAFVSLMQFMPVSEDILDKYVAQIHDRQDRKVFDLWPQFYERHRLIISISQALRILASIRAHCTKGN
ncbi:hypothetical protein QG37_04121 [Candidozyma auris]|nr:hypothetical protein QG37_04121 [[Candida] auris]